VDVRGLVALSAVGSAGDPEQYTSPRDRTTSAFQDALFESAGTQALAEDTGGFSVRNTNDLAAGAQRIAAESRVFYLLGLHPLPGKSARDWRKLRVEVKRPGLRVRARRGYTLGEGPEAAKAAKKEGRKEGKNVTIDRAVLRALDSAHDATGIPLRAIAYVFESLPKDATRVLVAAEFDTGRMSPAGQGRAPGGKLDLSMVATERASSTCRPAWPRSGSWCATRTAGRWARCRSASRSRRVALSGCPRRSSRTASSPRRAPRRARGRPSALIVCSSPRAAFTSSSRCSGRPGPRTRPLRR